jgi:hypothetical protein
MFYREEKFMKILMLILLTLASCSSITEGKYKKKYHVEDYQTTMESSVVHALLKAKMKACYPQSDYPSYEKTISEFDVGNLEGTISYVVDKQSLGPRTLLLVEVINDPKTSGSVVKIFAKGDLFRPASVYKHQVHKWITGKKVDCDSRGEI